MGLAGGRLAGSAETLHYVDYEIHTDSNSYFLMIGLGPVAYAPLVCELREGHC